MNNSKNGAHKTKKDVKQRAEKTSVFLDLPEAPDFHSMPPNLSVKDNIALCEQMLAVWNKKRFEQIDLLPILTEEFYL